MSRVAMLLSNPFRPDARVLKEASGLQALGHKITILAWDREQEYATREQLSNGIEIFRIQSIPSKYGIGIKQALKIPGFWMACWRHLTAIKPDLIHCHDFDTLPAGIIWGWIHKTKVIYDAHEYYADLVQPRLKGAMGKLLYHAIAAAERTLAARADAVITVDETLAAIYRRINHRVEIIGHYPPASFTRIQANVFQKQELTMIYSGRLSRDRGLHFMVDILKEVRSSGIPARLIVLGIFTPESEELAFRDYAGDAMQWVCIESWQRFEDVPQYLARADVGMAVLLSIPRYVAAVPVKIFEYMSVGLPVIASDFPLIRNIISESKCGFLVNPDQGPATVAAQLVHWWQNPEEARQAGNRGRQAVVEKYNFEALVEKLAAVYRALLPDS